MTQQSQPLIQQKKDVRDLLNSDRAKLEIAKVLPKHLTAERMTRVALTATLKTPSLLQCTPESLLNAVLLCSQAGLEPDGRLAHLIPYGNQVQVIFDWKGLVTLALRNGGMEQIYADKVCEHDEFKAWVENGEKKISHVIPWGKARGNPYCYYAVTRNSKGVIDWEVMTLDEVEEIRQRSRAKDSGPWKTDFDEMGKKTVIRRMSKRWDLLPEIQDVINADDDAPPPLGGVTVSSPVFKEKAAKIADAPKPADTTPEPAPADDGTHTAPPPSVTEPPVSETPVKRLRTLCRESKIKESNVIEFLQQLGSVDDTVGTFEEVALKSGPTIDMLITQWTDISGRIKGTGK